MRIRRIIAACTFAVIAVMFALPAGAYASGSAIMLSQNDFDSADNHCYLITKPGIYSLAQDVQGTLTFPAVLIILLTIKLSSTSTGTSL